MRSISAYGSLRTAGFILTLLLSGTVLPPFLSGQAELPDIPDLIRVTVDHTGNGVLIQWEASEDPAVYRYHLYKMNAELSFERLFSFGPTTLEYTHTTSGLKNLAYAVTAEDSAGNESLFGDNVHRAVTTSLQFDPCTPANRVTFTPYEGWGNQVSGYRIFGGPDSAAPQQLTFLPPSGDTYTHEGISPDTVYFYYAEAVHLSGITSRSATERVRSSYPAAPSLLTVDEVDVVDAFTVEIRISADISGQVNDFRLMRRDNPLSPFSETALLSDPSSSTHLFRDQVSTQGSSYEYVVQSLHQPGSCGQPLVISQSNPGTAILLEVELEDQTSRLSWTPYREYTSGLSGYLIQRRNGTGDFYDIQSVDPSTTTWNEPVQSVIDGYQPGELEYRVVAVSQPDSRDEIRRSTSNTASVHVETHLKVPSAFTPGSNDMNFEFKPVIDFAPREYTLIVYDRSGRKVFETTDPSEGWKGRFRQGEFVQEGVYVYYIQYTDFTGLFRSLTGNVTVLYP